MQSASSLLDGAVGEDFDESKSMVCVWIEVSALLYGVYNLPAWHRYGHENVSVWLRTHLPLFTSPLRL